MGGVFILKRNLYSPSHKGPGANFFSLAHPKLKP